MGLEHYTRLRDLGGSNGAFLACDRQDPSRKVVIKRLAEGQEGMTELNLSLRARHAHIVKMIEFFISDGELYGVLKYEEGGDLASLIARLRELEVVPKEVTLLRWFDQLLSALHFCHDERQIIHRDIKPSNIFLSNDDKQLFLGDFGSAKALTGASRMTETFVGSPMWISPEVLLGHAYTFSTDVWSLGCVFFEMATLRHPFHAHNFAHLVTKVTSGEVAVLPDAVPPSVRHIISQMLRYDPTARASARDLLRETREALPVAEAAEMASRRSSNVQSSVASPTKPPSPAQAAPTAAASAAAVRPPSAAKSRPDSAASSRHSSPATTAASRLSPPSPAVVATSSTPPPSVPLATASTASTASTAPPPSGLRTCTPTQMNCPRVPPAATSATSTPTSVTPGSRGGRGASGAIPPPVRTTVPSQQAAAEARATIPALVIAGESNGGGAAVAPGHLRRRIEAQLKHRRNSDSDSDSEDADDRQARVVEARDPLLVQGRRLSVEPVDGESSTGGRAQTGGGGSSSGRRGSLSTPASRVSASAGRDKDTSGGSTGPRSSTTGAVKSTAMRQRWYDRTPKPTTTTTPTTTTASAGRRAPAQKTTHLGTPAAAAEVAKPAPAAAALRSPPPAPPAAPARASAEPSPAAAGVNTWLAQYSDEASDIELYLRKFRDHDDDVLRTYDERDARGEAPFVVAKATPSPSPPSPPAVVRATPTRARQPSRRAAAPSAPSAPSGAAHGVSSPPRVPRRKHAETPVDIVVAGGAGGGGGVVYKAPPPPARQPSYATTEASPSPTPSAVRARPGAGAASRRAKGVSSNASPSSERYFSPKYERQPSALRAPIVPAHQPRQVSHARPPQPLTEAERRAAETERQEAKEKRESERERMKEMIKAQRAQQRRRHSVDVEIKLPDDMT